MSYLAIDFGTQSVRAIVFDRQGELLGQSQTFIEPYFSQRPGWAEQDPEYLWKALCECCQNLWAREPSLKETLKAVSLTTQRGTLIACDKNGRPLRPAISWLDQRLAESPPDPHFFWRQAFKLLGIKSTIDMFRHNAEANWIKEAEPLIWRNTHKFLLLSGFLSYRMTGQFVDSIGCQVGYIPFDYKNHRWAHGMSWKWQALWMPKTKLPRLVPQGDCLGRMTAHASQETGIPENLPLIATGADKACEVLGSGCLGAQTACLSFGTTATINAPSKSYVEANRYIPPYPAAQPNTYLSEIQIQRGYWLVSWFKKEFGASEVAKAKSLGVDPEALFEDMIQGIPPGCDGLMVQPYWSPGIRYPGPEAKGAMIGFHGDHTKAHVYKAILEGISFALREGKETIESRTKRLLTKVRVSGGGSKCDTALQITADIFNLPTEKPHTFETSALGAAISAAVGVGDFSSYREAVHSMTRVERTFLPDTERALLYDDLYSRVYQKMYSSLKPLYRHLGMEGGVDTRSSH